MRVMEPLRTQQLAACCVFVSLSDVLSPLDAWRASQTAASNESIRSQFVAWNNAWQPRQRRKRASGGRRCTDTWIASSQPATRSGGRNTNTPKALSASEAVTRSFGAGNEIVGVRWTHLSWNSSHCGSRWREKKTGGYSRPTDCSKLALWQNRFIPNLALFEVFHGLSVQCAESKTSPLLTRYRL